jgi:HlyD family secretion protein
MALAGNQGGFFGRRRWWVWTTGIVVAVVLLASFMTRDDSVPVRAATVARGTVRSVISSNGKVEPVHNFEAHAPIGTTVKKVLVREGDHVRKGQLLVALDDAEARSEASKALAQVRSSEADIHALRAGGTQEEVLTVDSELIKARTARDTTQRNLEALRRLQQSGAASPGEVKDLESQLARAEADVKLWQQKQRDRFSQPEAARVQAQGTQAESAYSAAQDILSQLHIHAPFDGEVYSLPVREGNYLNPGDLVLQEADLSRVQVRAFVDEPDVARLDPGQRIEITWDAMPDRVWQATVGTIPSTLKLRGTRNVGETTCIVDNHDFKLLPNVNVGVTIVTGEHRNALTVPREAIRQDDDKPYVYEIVNDQLQRRDVQIALANLTSVEVIQGIAEKANVALASTNSKPLHEGVAVKVVR